MSARTDLATLAKVNGYEIEQSASGRIVDTYTRGERKVQVKFSQNERILALYVNGQPRIGGSRSAVIAAITKEDTRKDNNAPHHRH